MQLRNTMHRLWNAFANKVGRASRLSTGRNATGSKTPRPPRRIRDLSGQPGRLSYILAAFASKVGRASRPPRRICDLSTGRNATGFNAPRPPRRIRDLSGQPGRLSYILAALAVLLAGYWAANHTPPTAFANSGGSVTYYTLTLCTPSNGDIIADPIGPSYVSGTIVTLTADSDPGYAFDYWTGALSGSVNPTTITMNAAKSVCAVFVADSTPPVITLLGDDPLYVECGDTYTDPGATASDNHNGDITAWIIVAGDTVDPDTPGEYEVTYDVQDEAENDATQVTRTVIVQDTTAPVITLLGDDPVDSPLGGTYEDAGATAEDTCDGDLTEEIVVDGDIVDDDTLGEYVITYDVTDSADNDAVQVTRTVNVLDMTPPVISLLGDDPQLVPFESTYSDPGATASDNVDGDLTANISVTGDTVVTSVPGDYIRYYDVTDAAGNPAETVPRTVTVLGPPRTLTVLGPQNGSVTIVPPNPAAVVQDGDPDYVAEYDDGQAVFLQADPDPGYVFDSWGGDLAGAGNARIFRDDFEGSQMNPAWTIGDGTWDLSGDGSLVVVAAAGADPKLQRPQSQPDLEIQIDYRRMSGTAPITLDLRLEDADNRLYLEISPGQVVLREIVAETDSQLAVAGVALSEIGIWYHLEVTLDGEDVRVWRRPVGGPEVLLFTAAATILESAEFRIGTGADTGCEFDNLDVRNLWTQASLIMDSDATVQANFIAADTTPPVITLTGNPEVTLDCGELFEDSGATASDDRDGDITENIVVDASGVDHDTPGTYYVTYDVMDRAGNAATQVTRQVDVGDTTAPAITLLGNDPAYLGRNDTYTDPGAEATDNCDTALPAVTVDSSDIDNTTFGSYVVTYNLLDAAENAAVEVTRTVRVVPKLTITNTNAGNTTPPAGAHLFELNTVVPLTASPAANFSHWEGDDIQGQTSATTSITMTADKSITAVFNAAAYFPDPNLEQAVRDTIDKPSGTIEFSDLEGVTSLDGSGYGIQDLTGLEQLADLTDLRLNNNSISDLSPVAYLTGLTHLELSNVNPSGIAALGSLTDLTFLDLSDNGITDVGDLAGLDSLESLDLSGNALGELQSFVDAGILAGGTLDLTGNPLEALAYHVYTRLIEGHVSSLSYDDILGHGTDTLRVLIVGVEQGLGSITINSVPAGGVSQYEYTNYDAEVYDLWVAEYPVETGTYDNPVNPVSITATMADGDGFLNYWKGGYLTNGPRDEMDLSLILYNDTIISAVIETRPGMGALDLVADFEDFVAEVLPAEDWETLDENNIEYPGGVATFAPNGMPDVVEIGLLEAVLKDPEIDFSGRSGVVSHFVWEAWEQNLAAAEAQLGPAISGLSGKPYLARIVAAYLTLGDYGSVTWIDVIMDAYAGQDVLDFSAYKRRYQRYFPADGNADYDTASNLKEWEGLTLTGVLATDIANFTAVALDPYAVPEPAAKGLSKQGESEGESECPNVNCIEPVDILIVEPEDDNKVEATRGDTGAAITLGEVVTVPAGTEIRVSAEANEALKYKFTGWSAAAVLIDGSREPQESFYAAPSSEVDPIKVAAIFKHRTVTVPEDTEQWTYDVSGAVYGYHGAIYGGRLDEEDPFENYFVHPDGQATLTVRRDGETDNLMWILQSGAPSHSRTNPVAVRSASLALGGPLPAGEQGYAVGLSAGPGGYLLGSSNGANPGFVFDLVYNYKNGVCRVDAGANAGYALLGIATDGPTPYTKLNEKHFGTMSFSGPVAGRETSARAITEEKTEYTLTLKPDGDDVPCSGYVTADPARKYYAPGTWVTLTATANPGYVFDGWSGGGTAKEGGVEKPLDQCVSKSISIVMNGDRTVTAKFRALRIILDPAHGWPAVGESCTVGKSSEGTEADVNTGSAVSERAAAFLLAQKVQAAILAINPSIAVSLTKGSADENLDLLSRARKAGEQKADIFLSLHFDGVIGGSRKTFAIVAADTFHENIPCAGGGSNPFATDNQNFGAELALANALVAAVATEIGSVNTEVWSSGSRSLKGTLYETDVDVETCQHTGGRASHHPQGYDERLYYGSEQPKSNRVKSVLLEVDNFRNAAADAYFNDKTHKGTPQALRDEVYEALGVVIAEVLVGCN